MTEAEWLSCTDPERMMPGTASKRKLRLFACACCRRPGLLLRDPRSLHAVEVAERFADGRATDDERVAAWTAARAVEPDSSSSLVHVAAAATAGYATVAAALAIADYAAIPRAVQCDLLRDLFGNPFRQAAADPAWLAWKDGGVSRLAQAIYDDRRFADLPRLGDLLASAGCTDDNILGHCRRPGMHIPGCWVVDALLDKG
jgi:hypothetical protein